MGITTFLTLGAWLGALSVGYSGYKLFSYVVEKQKRATEMSQAVGSSSSSLHRLLLQGIPPLLGVARALLRMKSIDLLLQTWNEVCRKRHLVTSPEALATVLLAGSFMVFATGSLIGASPLFGIMLVICVLLGIGMAVNRYQDEQRARLREQIPVAIQSMQACFNVGYSLPQTFDYLVREIPNPLGEVFREASAVIVAGGSVEEALATIKRATQEDSLIFIASALEIQHKTGASMTRILESSAHAIKSDLALKRSLKTQTAQAKLSAQVITLMPFGLLAIFSLVSPGFLDPFFESFGGIALFGAAVVMQAAGVVLVRRMLNYEG